MAGEKLVHRTAIKARATISIEPQTIALFIGLLLKRADVAGSIGGCLHNRPGCSALIGREGTTDHGNGINRRAAGEQGVGPGGTTIVS